MSKNITPTNELDEKNKGRIALWLDPEDIQWISEHCCCLEDTSEDEKNRCSRIRFRAKAALHKVNV